MGQICWWFFFHFVFAMELQKSAPAKYCKKIKKWIAALKYFVIKCMCQYAWYFTDLWKVLDNWSASNASIIGDVTLEKNTSIWFNVTLRGDVENIHIGEGSNIQDGSVLHTDPGYPLKIGKDVTIGHLVMLHGCTIEDNSLIGIGAVILNGAKIGKNCIIGANALVTENKVIPDNSLVVGSPGKIVRQVSSEEAKLITENAIHYQDNWKKYSKSVF